MIDFLLKQNKEHSFGLNMSSEDCTAVHADYHKENTEQIILRLSEEIHLQAECQCEKNWLEREQFWKVINPWK